MTFLCTRPALVSRLIEAGEAVRNVPNPFKPYLQAWEIEINSQVIEIAEEYYSEIEKPLPLTLQRWQA